MEVTVQWRTVFQNTAIAIKTKGAIGMLQPKIKAVRPLPDYKLLLEYETGEKRAFDVTPYISGAWYGELRDESIFKTVRPCGSTVEWAGGQDIAPHELYEMSVPCS